MSARRAEKRSSTFKLLADNSNVARKAINLHSLIGQQTFERMLTQMELMYNVVDLDRLISIHGEQIAETLITRPAPSRFAFPRSF
ncbi:hypothetical protein ALC60_09002 [Trachymyrmex zeteki]|uniref:Uncharacterized protein n=1 Tax=Mycetomoellerius zeteki TaxID=64791 RepID=A0A151WVP7_9HYME|nr:hypothetical protein ALC60_09002 [Trachymyrmex zeteki]